MPYFLTYRSHIIALLALPLSLACSSSKGSEAQDTTAASQAPQAEDAAHEASPRKPVTAPSTPQTPEEARAYADKLWQEAEKNSQDPIAWNRAAGALAAAAKMENDTTEQMKLLRGALAGWERADSLNPSPKASKSERTHPLPDREVSRVSVLGQLASILNANDAELGRIEYRRGRIHYDYGHFELAIPSFEIVIERFPASAEAEYAAQLLLDSLNKRGDIQGINTHVAAMLKNAALIGNRPELGELLLTLRHQAGRKAATKLVEIKNYTECGKAFIRLYKRDSKVTTFQGDQLLYNASVCQERSGQFAAAIKTLRKLAKTYPQSALAAQAKQRADDLKAKR